MAVDGGLIEAAHIFAVLEKNDRARALARKLYEIIVGGRLLSMSRTVYATPFLSRYFFAFVHHGHASNEKT